MSKTKEPKKPGKPGRWRRRTLWTLALLIALGLVARATIPLALPAVLRNIAGNFGMTCVYDRLELNLFSGDAGIWGLQFQPKEGGEAILAADYCHGNVSVLNLLRGRLNVWRVEADGVEVNIDRDEDGSIPLLNRFIAATSKSPAAAAAVTAKGKPADLDLSSPLRVDALRLDHIHVHIHDRGVKPEVDTELAMDLRLSDLGSSATRAKFEMNLSAEPLLDTLRINGDGQSSGKTLDANLNVLVRGIRPKPAAAYLALLGLRPASDGITLTAKGHLQTAPAPNNAAGFTASIAFDHLAALADRDEALALDRMVIDTGVIDTKSIRIERCIFEGARATAGRAEDGNIQIAGIEYDPALASHPKPTTQKNEPSTAAPQMPSLLAERWSVGELALKNARIDFHDRAITPAVHLSLVADELSATSIDHDPKNKNTTVTLTGRMHSHGMIRDIKIDGTAKPFADDKKFDVTVNASGIKPDAIKPYLDQIGLESTLKDAHFAAIANTTLNLGETITAGVKVIKFDFSDETPLFALTNITVTNAALDPTSTAISIGDIELSGPGISVLRDSAGEWNALGLRTKKPTEGEAPKSPPVVTATTGPAPQPFTMDSLPKITLAKFGWTGIHVELEDQTTTPPTKVSIPEIGITASNLTTVVDSKTQGTFKAWLNSPQVAKKFEVAGSVMTLGKGMDASATLDGTGLNALPLTPYLQPFGIEPLLQDGSVTGVAQIHLATDPISATGSLHDIKYTQGSSKLAELKMVQIEDAAFEKDGVSIESITVLKPHISARRDADGSVVAGGFRLLTAPSQNSTDQKPTVTITSTGTTPAVSASIPLVVALKHLYIGDASIDWTDLAVTPNVETAIAVDVGLTNVVLGKDAPPADLKLIASVRGAVDEITVTGPVSAAPFRQSAQLDIWLSGLHPKPLAAYFPPGISSSLKSGRLHANFDADLTANKSGGGAANLKVGPVDFADEDPGFRLDHPLFHLDEIRLAAPRIDLPDTALEVKEISVRGLKTHAEKLPGGEIACMGLVIGEKVSKPASDVAAKSGSPEHLRDRPVQNGPPATAGPAAGPTVEQILAASHRVLPSVTIDSLDLNVQNFTFTDQSRNDSAPLVVTDLRLHNVDRIDLLGKDAFGKPPTKLQFGCKISPLVDLVAVDIAVTPFARQPHVNVQVSATGIHGDGLTKLVPELKNQVDGTAMSDGLLTAHFGAEAKWDRRNPLDFDLSHGFDLDFVLDKIQYREKPDGPVLAGVDEVRSEAIRIAPADSIVHFKTLEITKPIGLITQDSAGIHALGWVYKLPEMEQAKPDAGSEAIRRAGSSDDKSSDSTPGKPGSSEYPRDRRPDAVVDTKPVGEIRIDKLVISGLDFQVRDSAVTPVLVIPLNGLDVEVRNLSSLAPYEDSPIRFSAIVNADKVNLPKRGSNPPIMEQRDLFSQITANGEVSLYPKLHGWAKTSVSGLDLAALQGAAAQFNETLTSGIYDSEVDLRFDPDGAVLVNSHFTLTDLSLSEPPNGLIYRTLHLPAPLDFCIGAVENQDKSISLQLPPIAVDKDHISYVDIGGKAAGAVLNVIATAIAAAPMKAANDVGGLIGLGGDAGPQDLTTVVQFSPGSAAFGPEQSAAVAKLLQEMHDDPSLNITLKHQLGGGDVDVARIRANPTAEQSAGLESQLRARKAELLRLRADAAGRARADLVSLGETAAAPSLDHLRAIDREITATDESLDQIGELLKPSAGKLAERRTRTAALRIATERMFAIRSAIVASGISTDRVKLPVAQFNPADDLAGGKVVILVMKKK